MSAQPGAARSLAHELLVFWKTDYSIRIAGNRSALNRGETYAYHQAVWPQPC